ncbi:hypothetical protein E5288_WYG020967 [Bos mutus]|uniref:Uncharacterized protein n=1 Tax=Bos mutus TaxID=72004 RepID=A0A6B0S5G7_9CETA|nr:hypothetical protein [Bos mutus]
MLLSESSNQKHPDFPRIPGGPGHAKSIQYDESENNTTGPEPCECKTWTHVLTDFPVMSAYVCDDGGARIGYHWLTSLTVQRSKPFWD